MLQIEREQIRELVQDVLDTAGDDELVALGRMAVGMARRRRLLRNDRRRDRARRSAVLSALHEVRDAATSETARPQLQLIDGGENP